MSFSAAVRSALTRYATFAGRARRAEYWWFYLFNILVSLATGVVDRVLDTAFDNEVGVVGVVTSLGLLLPNLAVTARRLHDTGRTGWWMLLPAAPVLVTIVAAVGAAFTAGSDGAPTGTAIVVLLGGGLLTLAAFITLLVFLCLDSNPGPNKYGPSPKQPTLPPSGPAGYYPSVGYPPQPPAPGYDQPHGYPQQPPAPPAPGYHPPQQ